MHCLRDAVWFVTHSIRIVLKVGLAIGDGCSAPAILQSKDFCVAKQVAQTVIHRFRMKTHNVNVLANKSSFLCIKVLRPSSLVPSSSPMPFDLFWWTTYEHLIAAFLRVYVRCACIAFVQHYSRFNREWVRDEGGKIMHSKKCRVVRMWLNVLKIKMHAPFRHILYASVAQSMQRQQFIYLRAFFFR